MNFINRSYQKELLDEDGISSEEIRLNMLELNTINTLLGGHSITVAGFKKLLAKRKQITVCEIGCGGGDNLAAIAKFCHQKKIKIHCIGIDIKQFCINVAESVIILQHQSEWIVSDYKNVQFKQKPDIIFSSLFCHHFTEGELIHQWQWMQQNATLGFFINDLHRHFLAYYSIKILTKVFSKSRLVKNDAPISVTRGFTKKELALIGNKAYLTNIQIQWQWAFRYLIIYKHASRN